MKSWRSKTLDAHIDQTRAPSATPMSNCTHWLKGHCYKGLKCPYLHDPPMKGVATPVAPATAPYQQSWAESSATGGGQDTPASGGIEKGKGKGKSKTGKVDNPKNLCAKFQIDQCTRTNCPFVHEMGTPIEQEELERLRNIMASARPRTNSPARGVKICFAYRDTGTCPLRKVSNFSSPSWNGLGMKSWRPSATIGTTASPDFPTRHQET